MGLGRTQSRPGRAAAIGLLVLAIAVPSTALAADDTTAPVGSVTINGGAAYTNQAEVTLSVPATDDLSGVATVEVSNDNTTWTPYAYAESLQWFLPYEPLTAGAHTVYVRWTDGAGNTSAVATDSITVDTTAPKGTIELYSYGPTSLTFRISATDASGIAGVRLSCDDGATWVTRPMATYVTLAVREGGLGCVGYGSRFIAVHVLDNAGNALTGGSYVELGPTFSVEFPVAAVTGQPFTIKPVLPDDYTLPAGANCRWEFRWGNDRSLDENLTDETFGSLLFDIPASGGKCQPWTFTLPWVPYRQYEIDLDTWVLESDGAAGQLFAAPRRRFGAIVGSTERRILSSSLPIVQVLPNTYTPIVGSPVTYTRYLVGGAVNCCTPTWTARLGNGENPTMWHQSGGATFTITPKAPGNLSVGWDRLSGHLRLGAVYDPPVRYADTTRPNTTTPSERIGGSRLGSTVPVTIAWTGTDKGWGIARYQLQRSVDGGAWASVSLSSVLARSSLQYLTAGRSYRYRARAVDKAGNIGYWDYGATFRARVAEDSSGAVTYRGTWSTVTDATASAGHLRRTSAAGATATYRFSARDIAWIAERGPGRGKVDVYVDGVLAGTVDLYAATVSPRLVVFSRSFSTVGTHTIVIRNRATSGRPRANVDAFVTLR